ncbi:MAG: murein L,D-transpeptidase catalytic domain family protein [Bacteroidales bacterium]
MLKKIVFFITTSVIILILLNSFKANANSIIGFESVTIEAESKKDADSLIQDIDSLERSSWTIYKELKMDSIIDFQTFDNAVRGYKTIGSKKRELLTIIDFRKPSTQERLYVLDMNKPKVLFVSHVSHGRNSGANYATSFSNKPGSYQSSLGFYQTENTYQGRNGYSLVLNGLEKGINDRAKERAIVIHGAPYSDPSVINSLGRLGRSQGCPALPKAVSKKIIDAIKGGSILYIHADNNNYLSASHILSNVGNMRG